MMHFAARKRRYRACYSTNLHFHQQRTLANGAAMMMSREFAHSGQQISLHNTHEKFQPTSTTYCIYAYYRRAISRYVWFE